MKNQLTNRAVQVLLIVLLNFAGSITYGQTISGEFSNITPGVEYTYTIDDSPCSTFIWNTTYSAVITSTRTSVTIVWSNVPEDKLYYTRNFNMAGETCDEYTNHPDGITIQINYNNPNAIPNNTICCNQSSPYGFTPALLGQESGSTTGAVSFQWMVSKDGINWSAVPNATSVSYQPPATNETVYYKRQAISGNNNNFSNVVKLTVTFPVQQVSKETCPWPAYPDICANTRTYCNNVSVEITGYIPFEDSECMSYYWQSSSNGIDWSNIPDAYGISYTVPAGITHVMYYKRRSHYNFVCGLCRCGHKSYDDWSNIVSVRAFDDTYNLCGNHTGQGVAKAYNSISTCSTGATIKSTAVTRLRSEGEIKLNVGFSTEPGAFFIAEIGPLCQTGNWREGTITEDKEDSELLSKQATSFDKVIPNPISSNAVMYFNLGSDQAVTIELFNLFGEKIKVIYESDLLERGAYEKYFYTDNLNSGIYLLKFSSGSYTKTERVVIYK